MAEYPDDADGAVLEILAEQGFDLSKPMVIEFAVAVPDEESANKTLEAMTNAGYESHIEFDEGEPEAEEDGEPDDIDLEDEEFAPSWTVFATIRMVPQYDEIIRIQADLDRIAGPIGGRSDGWGIMIDDRGSD